MRSRDIDVVDLAAESAARAGPFTCMCGRVLESMCAACSERSLTMELARRRPGLLDRLDRDGGMGAFDAYEAAIHRTIKRLKATGALRHRLWGERGQLLSTSSPDDPVRAEFRVFNEDWFLSTARAPTWAQVFEMIESDYARRIARIRAPATPSPAPQEHQC